MSGEEPPITLTQIRGRFQTIKSSVLGSIAANFEDLDTFLDNNTHLFTLLSVFIALAAYVTQTDGVELASFEVGGFVSTTLTIVVVVGLLILFKIIQFTTREGRSILDVRNIGVLGFGLLFVPLFTMVFEAVWASTEPLPALISVSATILGTYIGLSHIAVVYSLAERVGSVTRFDYRSVFPVLAFVSLILLAFMITSPYYVTDYSQELAATGFFPWLSVVYTIYTVMAFIVTAGVLTFFLLAGFAGLLVGTSQRIVLILSQYRFIRRYFPTWLMKLATEDTTEDDNQNTGD